MPRAGLDPAAVVAAAAALADETGPAGVTMGLVAERLGVRTPSLYKHIDSLADLNHGIAALAMAEAADAIRDAVAGLSGRDALAAMCRAFRDYVLKHPGRYAATTGATATGPGDPLALAGERVIGSMAAVLRGYRIEPDQMNHALRTLRSLLHGFATLQAANGFQWDADQEVSFTWLIDFAHRGLMSMSPDSPS
ncbi:TetR-like C-terminal domain-containing protein [Paractinoplanes toevensis]|uniref:TetR family transcriptional regulator n=1 Tax=Paractinoplanes toevensis TaxID=571911 RepID=A0A919W099_9ACTN|nr:TetR-like C-terminal domain-containing protein [Actinoplanes toevensis]GIM91052.1 TetR family transcriptional regulator [Actinoplanes toevensis]